MPRALSAVALFLALACLFSAALFANAAPVSSSEEPIFELSSGVIAAPQHGEQAAHLEDRCVGTQVLVGSVSVTAKATFATVKYVLKKPVKLTTVVFSPIDAPIETYLGIGSSGFLGPAKTNWTVRVNNLTPGKIYTFKINAPDPDCKGKDMIAGPPITPVVKMQFRRMVFTVTKIKMIDDSDALSCGDFTVFQLLLRFPSIVDKDKKVVDNILNLVPLNSGQSICSGDNFVPTTNTVIMNNTLDGIISVGFGAVDDDVPAGSLATYGLGIDWGKSPTSSQFDQANKVFSQNLPGFGSQDNPGTITKTYEINGPKLKFKATLKMVASFTPHP